MCQSLTRLSAKQSETLKGKTKVLTLDNLKVNESVFAERYKNANKIKKICQKYKKSDKNRQKYIKNN